MTNQNPRRNRAPEPVPTWHARLFRPRPRPLPTVGVSLAAVLRHAQDLRDARAEADLWKQHADSFAAERDGAYRERAQLLAWLAALHPAAAVIAPAPDIEDEEGWQLLYLTAGGWQMSWHIHPRDADLFQHVTPVSADDERAQWDGHDTEQKYERMRGHVRLLALEALGGDGPLTGVVTASEPSRDDVLREAFEVARAEGTRLEADGRTNAARGARSVAYLLRRIITTGTNPDAVDDQEQHEVEDVVRGA
ncbi:hypothetical protein AB0465_11425 [Streptomyces griseoviridis]|uniref:hypothetical protein n=1 Tax=Streptomyces griseoviridis TaxID=45398 RepID=UPI0034504136